MQFFRRFSGFVLFLTLFCASTSSEEAYVKSVLLRPVDSSDEAVAGSGGGGRLLVPLLTLSKDGGVDGDESGDEGGAAGRSAGSEDQTSPVCFDAPSPSPSPLRSLQALGTVLCRQEGQRMLQRVTGKWQPLRGSRLALEAGAVRCSGAERALSECRTYARRAPCARFLAIACADACNVTREAVAPEAVRIALPSSLPCGRDDVCEWRVSVKGAEAEGLLLRFSSDEAGGEDGAGGGEGSSASEDRRVLEVRWRRAPDDEWLGTRLNGSALRRIRSLGVAAPSVVLRLSLVPSVPDAACAFVAAAAAAAATVGPLSVVVSAANVVGDSRAANRIFLFVLGASVVVCALAFIASCFCCRARRRWHPAASPPSPPSAAHFTGAPLVAGRRHSSKRPGSCSACLVLSYQGFLRSSRRTLDVERPVPGATPTGRFYDARTALRSPPLSRIALQSPYLRESTRLESKPNPLVPNERETNGSLGDTSLELMFRKFERLMLVLGDGDSTASGGGGESDCEAASGPGAPAASLAPAPAPSPAGCWSNSPLSRQKAPPTGAALSHAWVWSGSPHSDSAFVDCDADADTVYSCRSSDSRSSFLSVWQSGPETPA